MADSTTPKPKPPAEAPLASATPVALTGEASAPSLDHFTPDLPLAVAYSGGADSTALLLACAKRWPGQVRAVHVHHGLQAAADEFAQHCLAVCARWDIPCVVQHVDASHEPGQSPEDAARRARYRALAQAVRAHWPHLRDVALAQHADDQVETLILALSRGAGLPGMAAMPARMAREGLRFHRPWLDVPGQALRAWLHSLGENWIEDPTNTDIRLTRNRIRHVVVPALAQAFPGYVHTFARSARHAAQAQRLLTELAAQDLAHMEGQPRMAALRQLSAERQANVLRHWLATLGVQASSRQLAELLDQIEACRTRGHQIHLKVGEGFVRREQDCLAWYNF